MKRFKHILCVVDCKQGNEAGLKKACQVATANDAKLSLIVTNLPSEHIKEQTDELKANISTLLSENIKAEDITFYFSHKHAQTDIIQHVRTNQIDLVITEPDTTSGLKKFFYGTTTLALLQKCPCAVWVVKPERIKPYQKIMAAVDPSNNDANTQALTNKIIEIAVSMAKRNQAECHIVHAWSMLNESALDNPFYGSTTKKTIEDDTLNEKIQHTRDFENMMRRQTIDTSACVSHIIKGDAKKELAKFVNSNEIDLVVMGTVEKVGLEASPMGSTAENFINQAECSILAIKPADF